MAGTLYQIRWSNPYTEPPSGAPRVLAEFFSANESKPPEDFYQLFTIGGGYSVFVQHVPDVIKPLSQKTLAEVRRKRLKRRLNKKYPLFAEQFEQEEIEKNPGYYSGMTDTNIEIARQEVIENEKKRLEYLKSIDGNLVIYAHEPDECKRRKA